MKTVCVYHSADLDGIMSAAIVKHWFLNDRDGIDEKYTIVSMQENNSDSKVINGQRYSLHFIGYNYGQPIPDLSEYDKVIMCDISFPKEEMIKIYSCLNEGNFIWIDHHISAISDSKGTYYVNTSGLRDVNFAACELTWKYFFSNEQMPEIVRLLGMYDSFRHKGTDEELKVLEFQYGARQCITNYEEAYRYLLEVIDDELHGHYSTFSARFKTVTEIYKQGQGIYKYLCTEAKQTYKNGFEIEFNQTHFHPHDGIKKFICFNKERFNPVNFSIDYHADAYDGAACFWYKNGKWAWSLYNDNGKVDCSAIAKQYGGGGHKGASGMIVNTETMLKIINK